MDLTLKRVHYSDTGVFGLLTRNDTSDQIAVTLERLYSGKTKVPAGQYTCVKGIHRLRMDSPLFETFELSHVVGHTGILFHVGNYATDSRGCILLGKEVIWNPKTNHPCLINESWNTFREFMCVEKNAEKFILTVL